MNDCKLKDEIINFVLNSPEAVNTKVAVFIAGMKAQKNLMDCAGKADEDRRMSAKDCFTDLKTGLPGK